MYRLFIDIGMLLWLTAVALLALVGANEVLRLVEPALFGTLNARPHWWLDTRSVILICFAFAVVAMHFVPRYSDLLRDIRRLRLVFRRADRSRIVSSVDD